MYADAAQRQWLWFEKVGLEFGQLCWGGAHTFLFSLISTVCTLRFPYPFPTQKERKKEIEYHGYLYSKDDINVMNDAAPFNSLFD